jgi:hypothetical protein
MAERTRLESYSNGIDNARYFIENVPDADLVQQAKNARMWMGMFAEELARQILAAGHGWDTVGEVFQLTAKEAERKFAIFVDSK